MRCIFFTCTHLHYVTVPPPLPGDTPEDQDHFHNNNSTALSPIESPNAYSPFYVNPPHSTMELVCTPGQCLIKSTPLPIISFPNTLSQFELPNASALVIPSPTRSSLEYPFNKESNDVGGPVCASNGHQKFIASESSLDCPSLPPFPFHSLASFALTPFHQITLPKDDLREEVEEKSICSCGQPRKERENCELNHESKECVCGSDCHWSFKERGSREGHQTLRWAFLTQFCSVDMIQILRDAMVM